MGKRIGMLIFLVFFICAFLGYLTNRYITNASNKSQLTATPLPTLPNQRNLLILVINDFALSSPEVKDLWALIIYYPQRKLIFQPLSPTPLPDHKFPKFTQIWDVENKLSSLFMDQATRVYQIPWQDYLVLDSTALRQLSQWSLNSDQGTDTGQELAARDVFTQICQRIQGSGEALSNLIEQQIHLPDHFHSSLSLETALEIRHRLDLENNNPLECVVFQP
ncbi:hypothetical protein [Thermanaerothrix sp.]|uniref:hypothetical protein n=1 Tax=Thermanaerothrix sp. TaxID=2972675 RepID=UPI003C7B0365